MSASPLTPRQPAPACKVLVVDDDRRVRELLEVALTANGFGVISAADGDEGLLRAQRERPDLVLLDVRLPKRSGLEVCDALRGDPTDPGIPIILISALAESDHRLQGFLRGADDYLAKPFSPRELIARVRRLIARASETRSAVRRALELERDIASLRREARHAGDEARREHGLRELADTSGRDLLGMLDPDALLERLLGMVHVPLRAAATAGLIAESDGTLAPRAVRGDRFERIAGLTLARDGALIALLGGLARPVRREELERMRDLREELAPLVSGRWDLLLPLVSSAGIEGAVLVEHGPHPPDPAAWSDDLRVLGGFAAVAVGNAREVRAQASRLLGARAGAGRPTARARAVEESRAWFGEGARALAIPPAERDPAEWALELGSWTAADADPAGASPEADDDPSGLAAGARRMLESAARGGDPDPPRVVVLLRALLEFRNARARGVETPRAAERALRAAAADPFVAEWISARATRASA